MHIFEGLTLDPFTSLRKCTLAHKQNCVLLLGHEQQQIGRCVFCPERLHSYLKMFAQALLWCNGPLLV
jgi:hypothetical protein